MSIIGIAMSTCISHGENPSLMPANPPALMNPRASVKAPVA